MLPSMNPQTLYDSSTNSGNLYAGSGSLSSAAATSGPPYNADPNSPEQFSQNIKVAIHYLDLISRLAETSLAGIEQVFHPASDSNSVVVAADILALQHYIHLFILHLTYSGVGALPLLTTPPEEGALLTQTTNAVTALYARQKQIQENNAVVASLLAASEGSRR